MLINQLLLIVSLASLGSEETSKGRKKTTNKNWAAVIVFKFIKTKYIIFYEAVLKWVTEGEHIEKGWTSQVSVACRLNSIIVQDKQVNTRLTQAIDKLD